MMGTAQQIKAVAEHEFETMAGMWRQMQLDPGTLTWSTEHGSHASHNSEIVLNAGQLERFTAGKSADFQKMFVRLILSHELGHRFQMSAAFGKNMKDAQGESVTFLECFADILAGYYMSCRANMVDMPVLMADPAFDMSAYQEKHRAVAYQVFEQVLAMDRVSQLSVTHPENEERRLAIRQGLLIGELFFLQLLLQQRTENPDAFPEEAWNRAVEIEEILRRSLHYTGAPGGVFRWMHEEAIRILNENNSVCRNLVLFDRQIQWNESDDNPEVRFSFRIWNNNDVKVRFAGRVTTDIRLRNNPSNVIQSGSVDSYSYDRAINPGDTICVQGTLRWMASDEYMPYIALPDSPGTLYWAFNFDKPQVDPVTRRRYQPRVSDEAVSDEEVTDMISFLWANRNAWMEYVKGIGSTFEKDRSKLETSVVFFDSPFRLRPEMHGYIKKDLEKERISCTVDVLITSSRKEAIRRQESLIDQIKSDIPQFTFERGYNIGVERVDFFTRNNKIVMEVRIIVTSKNEHVVQIAMLNGV